MFESELEVRMASALLALEVDAARFHPPSVEEVIALAESAPVTPQLISQLHAIDASTLTADQRVGLAVGWQRVANYADAQRALAVVATTAACPDQAQVPRELNAASELGPALGIGSTAADGLVAESTQLVEVLPEAHAMALAGNLSWRKASALASNTLGMDPDAARRVADKVLAKSWGRSPSAHDAAVRRAVDQVDPAHADRKRRQRERDIRLAKHHYGAGMGELFACLPSEQLDLIWTAADAFARRSKAGGDPRSLDTLRVTFLVHAARSFLTHGDPTHCDTICDPLSPDPTPDEPLPPEPDLPASFTNRDDEPGDDGDGDEGDEGGVGPGDDPPPAPPGPPTRHGRPVALHVIWDLTSLLGLTDHCALLRDSATMLPPSAMRDLLAGGGRIRRMVIDPETGEQLDLTPTSWPLSQTDGRAHRQPVVLTLTTTARWDDLPDDIRAATDACDPYLTAILRELLDHPLTADDLDNTPDAEQPSPALAEHVASRAGHPVNPCAGPTAASAADLDHHQARADGGTTIRTNLGPFVRRWHRIKTFTDWTVRQVKRGWEWTSPTGRRYTIEPHDYRLGP
jgi:hypothetical protein